MYVGLHVRVVQAADSAMQQLKLPRHVPRLQMSQLIGRTILHGEVQCACECCY
jgi:hypothetical protein